MFANSVACCFFGCQNQSSNQITASSTVVPVSEVAGDNRPKEELTFLNRVAAESDYEITSNAAKKDAHVNAFNKYATDSLKNLSNWEMIVTEINDEQYDANTIAKAIFDLENNPVYNLKLVAPIKIDKTADTIAIDNRVNFTATIPKTPKGDALKSQLEIIKNLSKGDTVVVSGAITHLDSKMKVNFVSFYDQSLPWDVDLLLNTISKKGSK